MLHTPRLEGAHGSHQARSVTVKAPDPSAHVNTLSSSKVRVRRRSVTATPPGWDVVPDEHSPPPEAWKVPVPVTKSSVATIEMRVSTFAAVAWPAAIESGATAAATAAATRMLFGVLMT